MFKSTLFALQCIAVFVPIAGASDGLDPSEDRVRAAIKKALPTLEAGSIGSANQRQCFTCHSQAVPVFALVEAKRLGFKVDAENLNRQLKHTHDHLQRGLENYKQGKGQGGDVLTAGYALWTLDEGNQPADDVTQAVSHYLLNAQKDIDHWRHRGNRPPTSGSDFTATYVALRALHHFGTDDQQGQIAERQKLVGEWLAATLPVETEDFVFRLGSFQYVDGHADLIKEATSALLAIQREDGGWGQREDMSSDAYSTGTALSVLIRDGKVLSTNESILKGMNYLLSTQLADGTWQVTTRAKPVQEYFESGFPHGKDQFISVAATAWSTLALLQSLPAKPIHSVDLGEQTVTARLHSQDPVFSGPQPGELIVPFQVRSVSASDTGELVDYVENAKGKSLLLVFVHDVNRQSISLVRNLTAYSGKRIGDGLHTGVIFLHDDANDAEKRYQTMKHALTADTPTGISLEGREGPSSYGLNRLVTLTILLSKDDKVVANYALVQPSLQADLPKIVKSITEVVGGQMPTMEELVGRDAMRAMQDENKKVAAPDVSGLVRPLIQKNATDEQVTLLADKIEKAMNSDGEVRREIYRIATAVADLGYGTPKAQEYLTKWAKEHKERIEETARSSKEAKK